uniref:Uncharacterized protein n=1 Tax=Oryza punctata TaxID=4537 RepID=A0A0E0K9M3_ORYPU
MGNNILEDNERLRARIFQKVLDGGAESVGELSAGCNSPEPNPIVAQYIRPITATTASPSFTRRPTRQRQPNQSRVRLLPRVVNSVSQIPKSSDPNPNSDDPARPTKPLAAAAKLLVPTSKFGMPVPGNPSH